MITDLLGVDVLGLYRDDRSPEPRYYASVRSHLDNAVYAMQIDEAVYRRELGHNPLIIDRVDIAA